MLDLRSLRHLVVLARRLNYVRAAHELGVTQPTLSRSIQGLERQLGVQLFDRDRGGVALTPQGRSIADRAALLLLDAEELERTSKLAAAGQGGRIRFGMAPMPARSLLSRTLSERLKAAPAVTHEVVVRDVEALWGMLLAGEIEFFVSPNPPLHDLSEATVEVLGAFPLSVIVRGGHPLLEGEAGGRYPLLRSSWTGISAPQEIQPLILGPPNVVEDFATLAAITAATDALWLSSAFAIDEEIARGGLKEFFRAPQHIEVVMYALRRRSLSPVATTVAEVLRDNVRQVLRDHAAAGAP
jgi:DNA-binding transcriptional LysR family regulator